MSLNTIKTHDSLKRPLRDLRVSVTDRCSQILWQLFGQQAKYSISLVMKNGAEKY
ncbi:hypothetical protein V7152_22340 [Neobacillus drentensis]